MGAGEFAEVLVAGAGGHGPQAAPPGGGIFAIDGFGQKEMAELGASGEALPHGDGGAEGRGVIRAGHCDAVGRVGRAGLVHSHNDEDMLEVGADGAGGEG